MGSTLGLSARVTANTQASLRPASEPTHLPHHPLVFSSSSFKSWGCGLERRDKDKAVHEVLREEYRKLGPFSFAEVNVLLCFFLLIGLWFSRDPGFMPGWLSITWTEGKTK